MIRSIWRHGWPTSLLRRSIFCIRTNIRDSHFAVQPNTGSASQLPSPLQINQRMSPTLNGKPETFGNFDLVKRVELDYTDVVVSKWQSRVTGLSVVHLDFEGGGNHQSVIVT
jgi:hypothetical protein